MRMCVCVLTHRLLFLHYAHCAGGSKKQRAVWVNCMQSVAIVSWCCCCCCECCCCCCCRDKGCTRLRPGHDSVCVTMGNTALRGKWTNNKGSHKMATATATATAAATAAGAIVGNKRHVRVKGTPTQQHQKQQQDDGDNNRHQTHTHTGRAPGRCLPACACHGNCRYKWTS